MALEWDEAKRRQNGAKHGIDFPAAALALDGRNAVLVHTPRKGEDRWRTTAVVEGRIITVIWTWRGTNMRVISARRARDAETREYRLLFP